METPRDTPVRAQRQLRRALGAVTEVQNTWANDQTPQGPARRERLRKIYGGLCHRLPVVVRQSGLCQTVAWIEANTRGDSERAEANKLLQKHVTDHLREEASVDAAGLAQPTDLLPWVASATQRDYMVATRLVLEAAIYSKRLAVSVLGVKPGDEATNAGGTDA